jgi:hypothetical protein
MRAREFITERKGKISHRHQQATRGLDLFRDRKRTNSDYVLNRVMMAVASADGSDAPVEMDQQSWVGTRRSAHPYTEVEQRMLKQAFRAAGAEYKDVNEGDMDSEEMNDVNRVSPVKPFKGYPR